MPVTATPRQLSTKTIPIPYRLMRRDYEKVEAIAALTGTAINDVIKAALRHWFETYVATEEYEERHRTYVEEPQAEYDAYIAARDPFADPPAPAENPYRARVGRKDSGGIESGSLRVSQLLAANVASKAIYLGISQNDLVVEALEVWTDWYPHQPEFNDALAAETERDAKRCLLLGVPLQQPPTAVPVTGKPARNRTGIATNRRTAQRRAAVPAAGTEANPETSPADQVDTPA